MQFEACGPDCIRLVLRHYEMRGYDRNLGKIFAILAAIATGIVVLLTIVFPIILVLFLGFFQFILVLLGGIVLSFTIWLALRDGALKCITVDGPADTILIQKVDSRGELVHERTLPLKNITAIHVFFRSGIENLYDNVVVDTFICRVEVEPKYLTGTMFPFMTLNLLLSKHRNGERDTSERAAARAFMNGFGPIIRKYAAHVDFQYDMHIIAAENAEARRDYNTVVARYLETIDLFPKNDDVLRRLILALYDAKRIDEALTWCQRAIDYHPHMLYANILMGAFLGQKNDQTRALPYLRAATAIDPRKKYAWSALSLALSTTFHHAEAIRARQRCVALDVTDKEELFILGTMLFNARDFAAARTVLDRVLQLDSRNPDAFCYAAATAEIEGNREKAMLLLDRLLQFNANSQAGLELLGCLHERGGDTASAGRVRVQAEAIKVTVPDLLKSLTHLYYIGDFPRAKKLAQSGLSMEPENKWLLDSMAWIQHNVGEDEAAAKNWQLILNKNPDFLGAAHALCIQSVIKGKAAEGFALLERFCEANPACDVAHVRAAMYYLWYERFDDAFRHFEIAVKIDPGAPEGYLGPGIRGLVAGRFIDARNAFWQVAERFPEYMPAVFLAIRAEQRAPLGTIEVVKVKLTKNPLVDFTVDDFYTVNNILKSIDDLDARDELSETFVMRNPFIYDSWLQRANVMMLKGDFKNAISSCKRALEINPWIADIRETLAEVLILAGDFFEATKVVSDLAQTFPDHLATKILQAKLCLYKSTPEIDRGRDFIKAARASGMDGPMLDYVEAVCHVVAGNMAETINMLKKCFSREKESRRMAHVDKVFQAIISDPRLSFS
nr:tetratricopeptide repeat protein [Candidatus Sigynarchaeum springense]